MIRIEEVRTNALETVEKLAQEIWSEHYTPIIGAAQVSYMLEQFQSVEAMREQMERGMCYFLLYYDEKPAGYMGITPQSDRLFLSKLYVRAPLRRKGLARRALHFLNTYAVQHGLKAITLTVNRHNRVAITAYECMGFAKTGEVVQKIGKGFVMDDFAMEKAVGKA